jgi:hypothetical protein
MFPNKLVQICAILLLAAAGPARAQVRLPTVQVPNLPGLPTEGVNRTVNGVLEQANPERLRDLREIRIRNLLRTHRTVLEADPRGAPMVRSEVVALSPTQAALDRARAAGFGVGRTRTLEGLGFTIVVLQAPPGMSTRRALARLRRDDPEGTYDFNHLYFESGEVTTTGAVASPAQGDTVPLVTESPSPAKVGLIDGGVQRSHPVFNGVTVHEHGCEGGAIPSAHGTAVASLLVGRSDVFHGAAPGAELFAADVYCGLPTGGALDSVAEAFAWMSREAVPVINISLVGPPNALLEQIVRTVAARGQIVVAAVGNDGPSAAPLYPAAYPDVVAVTAVDAKRRVLMEACRGKHVDFAAPGADMSAASIDAPFGLVRGTSFAAPIVAGLLAGQIKNISRERADAAVARLITQATDLGARGVDKVYGHGLVGNELRPPEQLAAASR